MSEGGVVVGAVAATVSATTAHPLPIGGSHHGGAPPRNKVVAAIRMQKSQKCRRYGKRTRRHHGRP